MIDPRAYTIDLPDYGETAFRGLQQGLQTAAFITNQKTALEKARKEAIQQQQMQQELSAFASKPNKTHEDYANIMAQYPALAEDFQRSYNVLDTGRQQSTFKTASRVYSAAAGGRVDIAKSILETEALGYENAGDKTTADQMRTLAKMADESPEGFMTSTGLFLASANPDKFKDVLGAQNQNDLTPFDIENKQAQTGKLKEETKWISPKAKAEIGQIEADTKQTEIENDWLPDEKQWNIENIKSQIGERSGRLQLDRDTLETNTQLKFEELGQSQTKLSDGMIKHINDAVMDSAAALSQAQKFNGLADRYAREGQAGGIWSSGWAGFKRTMGFSNDEQNAMIREYDRLINEKVIQSLPPGAASDTDIALALKGFPAANADAATITKFLRGMAKMSEVDSIHKQMAAEWMNQNGQLGSSKRDIEVLGVQVPQGTTFPEFYQKNLGKMLKSQDKRSRSQQASTGQAIYFNISP